MNILSSLALRLRKHPARNVLNTLAALTLALCLAPTSHAQNFPFTGIVLSSSGRPIGGASVTVCLATATGVPCSPAVTLYGGATNTPTLPNPTLSDSLGNFSFYVPPDTYQYCMSGAGIQPVCYPFFIAGGGSGSGVSSFNTRTGTVVSATNDYSFSQLSGSLGCGQAPTLSGDVSNSGCAITIANGVISTIKIATAAVTEAKLGISDNTTANVSSSAHGFAPKFPNDASKYLDGTGAYTTPTGGVTSGTSGQLAYYPTTGQSIGGTNDIPAGTTAHTQPPGTNNNTIATMAALLAAVQSGSKAIQATAYGVFADANTDGTASMTSGSNQVTTSSIAIPFTSAMQGDIFFGTNAPVGGGFSGTAGTVIINGYICLSGGYVDAHTVNICTTPTGTTHANSTGSCTSTSSNGLCQATWGAHDDGPALQTAFTAAMQNDVCGHLILPDGNMLTSIVPHVTTSQCGNQNTNVSNFSYAVTGGKMGTSKIIPLPSLDLSDSTNGCDQVSTLCFFSSRLSENSAVLADFTIDGVGNGAPLGSTGTYYLLGIPPISTLQNISVYNYANGSLSNVGCASNAGGLFDNLNCWNGGYNGVSLVATFGPVIMRNSWIINPGGSEINCGVYQAITYGNEFNGGTVKGNVMTVISGTTSTAGIWNSTSDSFENGGPQDGYQVMDISGFANLTGDQLVNDISSTGIALGMSWNGNPGFVHAQNTQFRGGSGFWISGHVGGGGSAAGGIFTDLGNNSTSGTINSTDQSNFTVVNYPAEPSIGGRCLLASAASPLACGYSGNGIVAIPTTTTTYAINTQAVLAGSVITLSPTTDCSGVSGTPTCILPSTLGDVYVSARTVGTSFTISLPSTSGIVGVSWSIR